MMVNTSGGTGQAFMRHICRGSNFVYFCRKFVGARSVAKYSVGRNVVGNKFYWGRGRLLQADVVRMNRTTRPHMMLQMIAATNTTSGEL